MLSLTARYGKDMPVINGGLVWRVFADRPDETGTFKLIREDRGATPNIVLPPGSYVVHVALGLVSAVRPVTLKSDTVRKSFVLPAGGLRIEGRVGTSKIPQNQISFAIYKGSQFEAAERAPLVPSVAAGDVALLPEGTYYIISNYGDANSVVRSDIRVQAGKLTDVIVTHRAAVITLKLVGDKGGEALANTAWSVITPGGDVIKESIGAFPRVVLSEGEYRAIAKNEGKVFERPVQRRQRRRRRNRRSSRARKCPMIRACIIFEASSKDTGRPAMTDALKPRHDIRQARGAAGLRSASTACRCE